MTKFAIDFLNQLIISALANCRGNYLRGTAVVYFLAKVWKFSGEIQYVNQPYNELESC